MQIIKCKTCKKAFETYPSRVGVRKYCSKDCAKKDNYGFKPKKRNCKICSKGFVMISSLRLNDKTCSKECWYENNKRISHIRKNAKSVKICKICGNKFVGMKYVLGTGKCLDCQYKHYSVNRKGKDNPNFRKGRFINDAACQTYRKNFLKKYRYLFCEVCGVNKNGTWRFEVHHIYFRSRVPKHKNLNNPKNLILICKKCHENFHAGKKYQEVFKRIENERGLKELFKKGKTNENKT